MIITNDLLPLSDSKHARYFLQKKRRCFAFTDTYFYVGGYPLAAKITIRIATPSTHDYCPYLYIFVVKNRSLREWRNTDSE